MIDFDKIMRDIVAGMTPVSINSVAYSVRYEWGRERDVDPFLRVYQDKHFPLIWSVPKVDRSLDMGARYQRDAEFVLCTRETRDLLNVERIDLAFAQVLYPLWDAFERAIEASDLASIVPDTTSFLKFPNYTVNGKHATPEVWDALRVSCTVDFNDINNC